MSRPKSVHIRNPYVVSLVEREMKKNHDRSLCEAAERLIQEGVAKQEAERHQGKVVKAA